MKIKLLTITSISKKMYTLIAAVMLFSVSAFAQGQCVQSPSTSGDDLFEFVDVVYDYPSAGQSTWYYSVTSGTAPAISHVTLKMNLSCLDIVDMGTWGSSITDLSSGNGKPKIGRDPKTGVKGLKFDKEFNEGASRNYYFTLDQNYAVEYQTLIYSKAGTQIDETEICGPSTTCALYVGCDNFSVQANGGTISCAELSVSLDVTSLPNASYAWSGPDGFTSNEENPEVVVAGTYTVDVVSADGCEASAEATVSRDDASVVINLEVDAQLDCNNDEVTITAEFSNDNIAMLYWNGPDNYESDEQNLVVDQAGVYAITVVGNNGCISIAEIAVEDNPNDLAVEAEGGAIDCNTSTIQITATPSQVDVSYAWTGPNGFTSDVQNPEVNEGGTYELVVTSPENCTANTSVEVVDNVSIPELEVYIVDDAQLSCLTQEVQLEVVSNEEVTYLWTGPNNFTADIANPSTREAGTYVVTVENTHGCTMTEEIVVERVECGKVCTKVWYDDNGNGIQDNTEQGVGGVVVALATAGPDGEFGTGDEVPVEVLSTLGDGTVCFDDVVPGEYSFYFVPSSLPAGYTFTIKDEGDEDADSDVNANGFTDSFLVNFNDIIESVDAGLTLPSTQFSLFNFEVKIGNTDNSLLSWETSGEPENVYFEVERSNDGVDFQVIGTVIGTGEAFYPFDDQNPVYGDNYYRIKIIFADGSFEYSAIQAIAVSFLNEGNAQVNNNLTYDVAYFRLITPYEVDAEVDVVDETGSVIYNLTLAAGATELRIDLQDEKQGYYFVYLTINNERQLVERILKVNP